MALVTCVTLESVSYHLPGGSCLFSDLDLHLDQRRTGLVGRNGVGKSILAQLIAGDISPSEAAAFATALCITLHSKSVRILNRPLPASPVCNPSLPRLSALSKAAARKRTLTASVIAGLSASNCTINLGTTTFHT